ncbi:outer envelope pore protein 16, chloroplastic [Cinnamomum micranthum f. kanehirae]|uniref:Outer envelope pore protein 16, chloroplastic n=1 Tax=Cinnamomum micranthum f. kanehirae TaxID=337451 RepID=A0A443PXA8_9MAGN|nr:outer envelope pore protein 16, chloroplastic [Cinnamomum micranthum f. kanehirae]
MPRSSFSGGIASPKVDVMIDMGNPFLNLTLDGFLKIGTVGALRVAAEETYHCVQKGSISSHKFEHTLKKMCKEGAYWGTVAGVYVGMEYGAERVRGTRDWKNALIGGAITGAVISAASNDSRDKVVVNAITGGAIATAAEFLNYLT